MIFLVNFKQLYLTIYERFYTYRYPNKIERGGGSPPAPPPCMADYDKFSCFEYHNIECENTITISMNLHKYILIKNCYQSVNLTSIYSLQSINVFYAYAFYIKICTWVELSESRQCHPYLIYLSIICLNVFRSETKKNSMRFF